MGLFSSLLGGGKEMEYSGGNNPNADWISGARQDILTKLRDAMGTENGLPADRKLNISIGGVPMASREHPDISKQWDRLANFAGWGPIERAYQTSESSDPGLFSLLGLGASLMTGGAGGAGLGMLGSLASGM